MEVKPKIAVIESVSTNLNSFSQKYIGEQTGDVEGTEKAIMHLGQK